MCKESGEKMSELALERSGMVMPSRYVEIDREEMTYIEGGYNLDRSWVAFAIDGIAMLTPLGAALAPIKYLGKTAAIALAKKYAPQIVSAFGSILKAVGIAGSFSANASVSKIQGMVDANFACLTSFGGVIALIADSLSDGKVNGIVRI